MKESFYKNSIEEGPEEGRSLEKYEEILGFKKEDLEGKVVLDLGSGPGARFAKDLERSGVRAEVVSLSPDYVDERHRKLLKITLSERLKKLVGLEEVNQKANIAATAENLPFKDESFDKILALFSVSSWSASRYKQWLPEIMRILKSGGDVRIGPFHQPTGFDRVDSAYLTAIEEREKYIDDLEYKHEFIAVSEAGKGDRTLIIYKKLRPEINP